MKVPYLLGSKLVHLRPQIRNLVGLHSAPKVPYSGGGDLYYANVATQMHRGDKLGYAGRGHSPTHKVLCLSKFRTSLCAISVQSLFDLRMFHCSLSRTFNEILHSRVQTKWYHRLIPFCGDTAYMTLAVPQR